MNGANEAYRTGAYKRLSREDGDKAESDSILNQQRVIEDYCSVHADLEIVDSYVDDGFTGTNFSRPDFQRMMADIESGRINCVIVKDLSRFGRDYIDMGYYLERVFPQKGVRFIAINDHVDSLLRPYDMMLPLKNVFNTQYAKDISEKIRSAFKAKQKRGEFIGAFASYGYRKDPANHNHLIIDPAASAVVRRVFQMAAEGYGQIKIAKILNEEQIPCPSIYKKLNGENYTNSRRLDKTAYWTYSSIHKMLRNEIYRGNMVANRYYRSVMHSKAKKTPDEDIIIVEDTHEPIISEELWNSVQAQITKNTRSIPWDDHVHTFAGLIKCGDCGRALCRKKNGADAAYFSCGSYERYGPSVCSKHSVSEKRLEEIILQDLNRLISAVKDLKALAKEIPQKDSAADRRAVELARMEGALQRVQRLKKSAYEDYRDNLLSKEEFLQYKADYDDQETGLKGLIRRLNEEEDDTARNEWMDRLLQFGKLETLDRLTLVQLVQEIRVFENRRIEITYLFSEALRSIIEGK